MIRRKLVNGLSGELKTSKSLYSGVNLYWSSRRLYISQVNSPMPLIGFHAREVDITPVQHLEAAAPGLRNQAGVGERAQRRAEDIGLTKFPESQSQWIRCSTGVLH